MRRRQIDLTGAGPDWQEWRLGPYGKARNFRLITPTGEALTPQEIAAVRVESRDYGYVVAQMRTMERDMAQLQQWCNGHQADLIRQAFAIIEAALPAASRQNRLVSHSRNNVTPLRRASDR